MEEDQTIADIVAGSADFDILRRALSATGLDQTLAAPDADATVFAPSDDAFARLAVELGFTGDTQDDDAVFSAISEALANLSQDGDPIPLLTDVLEYHVAPGAKTLSEIAGQDSVATLQDDATIAPEGQTLADNDPDLANPGLVQTDIQASNGIVHSIDGVLAPTDLPAASNDDTPGTIADAVAGSSDFDILETALNAANLTSALAASDADLTAFAPSDRAFKLLARDLGFAGDTSDEDAVFNAISNVLGNLSDSGDPIPLLTDILEYHVSPGAKTLSEIGSQDSVATLLDGTSITPQGGTLVDNEPDLANPDVVAPNRLTDNGIVHSIDRVLIPSDLPGAGAGAASASQGNLFVENGGSVNVANTLKVFGRRDGDESALVEPSVDNVRFDANLERIDLPESLGAYTFEVTDNGLTATTDGTTVFTLPSANQTIELRFADGATDLSHVGPQTFDLGGETIETAPVQPDLDLNDGMVSATAVSTTGTAETASMDELG